MEVTFLKHNYLKFAIDLKKFELNNLIFKKGKIVVKDKGNEGYLVSPIVNTLSFDELVGSWSAITNATSTCELQISVKSQDVWSKFFSYGEWGLGKENYFYNQDDEKVYMNVDEILLKNNCLGEAFKYKVILKKDAKLSLVCLALRIPGYENKVANEFLPSIVDYNVPKLNQNIVPVIGHEICSATTSTMLLKFKGFDFSQNDKEFEHRYIASLVADPGHNSPTYGNWVYNTAVIGAYGVDAYVARTYSWEELKYHLAKVGPVGASIKGDTGVYKTNGHLIVVRGYKEVNGETFVICNDPNINSRFGENLFVYYEFPLDVFMKFYRGVAYIVL